MLSHAMNDCDIDDLVIWSSLGILNRGLYSRSTWLRVSPKCVVIRPLKGLLTLTYNQMGLSIRMKIQM